MKQRCLNPNHKSYVNYGGRGISIHSEWIESFSAFASYIRTSFGIQDIPRDLEIDRIDNEKGYEPGNIRLSTRQEQANNRRTNLFVQLNGEEMTLGQASKKTGVHKATLHRRITHKENDPFRTVEDCRVMFEGKLMTISDLSRLSGVPRRRLSHRIRNQKLSPEEAISSEVWKGRRKHSDFRV